MPGYSDPDPAGVVTYGEREPLTGDAEQKALVKAIWHCICDASSMQVVLSGGEVNQAISNFRAAIEAEAVRRDHAALAEAVRVLQAHVVSGYEWDCDCGGGRACPHDTGLGEPIDRAAVLALLDPK